MGYQLGRSLSWRGSILLGADFTSRDIYNINIHDPGNSIVVGTIPELAITTPVSARLTRITSMAYEPLDRYVYAFAEFPAYTGFTISYGLIRFRPHDPTTATIQGIYFSHQNILHFIRSTGAAVLNGRLYRLGAESDNQDNDRTINLVDKNTGALSNRLELRVRGLNVGGTQISAFTFEGTIYTMFGGIGGSGLRSIILDDDGIPTGHTSISTIAYLDDGSAAHRGRIYSTYARYMGGDSVLYVRDSPGGVPIEIGAIGPVPTGETYARIEALTSLGAAP